MSIVLEARRWGWPPRKRAASVAREEGTRAKDRHLWAKTLERLGKRAVIAGARVERGRTEARCAKIML